jgi:hypothetical protein
MREIITSLRYLYSGPFGHNADGRPLGLGLATALAKQRESMDISLNTEDIDKHVRRWADDERVKTTR